MTNVALDAESCGLVRYVEWHDTFDDPRYKLVKVGDYKVYALKPQYFTRSNIGDLEAEYGKMNPGLFVNSVTIKGRGLSSDSLLTKSNQGVPITLGPNPMTGEDPLIYARNIAYYDTLPNHGYILDYPRNVDWSLDKLLFSYNVGGVLLRNVLSATGEYDVTKLMSDAYWDTNESVSITLNGGGSFSMPAYMVKRSPMLKVEFKRITFGGYFYTATLAGYKSNGIITCDESQRAYTSEASTYFIHHGRADYGIKHSDWYDNIAKLITGEALGALSGVTEFISSFVKTDDVYANRKIIRGNIGGGITQQTNPLSSPVSDSSSIGKQVDNFISVSYPIKGQMALQGSPLLVSYVWYYPADLEKNKGVTIEINRGFNDTTEFINYVKGITGAVPQILSATLTHTTMYGDYPSWYEFMVQTGELL